MKHYRPALSWCPRLTNRHGAAFLLAIYVASLMLLLLGGVSLQRSTAEARASQVSRDLNQSFWITEATLDRVMIEFRAGTIQALMAAQPASANAATPRCVGGNVTDAQLSATTSQTSAGTYRVCETQEPALYTLEVLGQIGT
ncbi:MAG: hypothetical protein HY353_00670, partial [Candidatus Omnitrophica bacterium]|nr:hypothetical protein [Candidatus Omnitrophota bacterium]